MTIVGLCLAVLGYALRYLMRWRVFNRRNAAGVEEFKSFEHATGNRLAEGAGRLAGTVLLVGGLLLALISYLTHR